MGVPPISWAMLLRIRLNDCEGSWRDGGLRRHQIKPRRHAGVRERIPTGRFDGFAESASAAEYGEQILVLLRRKARRISSRCRRIAFVSRVLAVPALLVHMTPGPSTLFSSRGQRREAALRILSSSSGSAVPGALHLHTDSLTILLLAHQ